MFSKNGGSLLSNLKGYYHEKYSTLFFAVRRSQRPHIRLLRLLGTGDHRAERDAVQRRWGERGPELLHQRPTRPAHSWQPLPRLRQR